MGASAMFNLLFKSSFRLDTSRRVSLEIESTSPTMCAGYGEVESPGDGRASSEYVLLVVEREMVCLRIRDDGVR